MEFLNLQEKGQLQQILTNKTLLRTADADLRSAVLSNCGLGKYCSLLRLDATPFQFVVSLCAQLSEVSITVENSERLGLIVFLEYISEIDLNLSAEDKEFIQYVISKWEQEQANSPGSVPSVEPINSSLHFMHILHLSDLHFGTSDQAKLWSGQLAEDLCNELNCPRLDALILSGDIANYSTPDEYKAAKQFLDNLRQDFPLKPEQIIIVPGNHDLNWKLAKKAYQLFDREDYKGKLKDGCYIEESESVIRVRDEEKYKERFAHFSDFYEAIKGKPYPTDYDQQCIIDHLPNLLILGLNSAWQLDHHYKSRASIHPDAINNALSEIRRNKEKYENCLKIAVWHHPLDSAGDDRITDQGFMERLAVSGFRLFLHGHIHKAETSLYRYDMSQGGRKLDRICAGTFGAHTRELMPGYPWQYNLLKFQENQLTVETRRREEPNGAWKPDARWSQGSGQDPLPRYKIPLK
ncbi:MAG: metallophosphoesterase [Xenococcaceae cyanobacterium]